MLTLRCHLEPAQNEFKSSSYYRSADNMAFGHDLFIGRYELTTDECTFGADWGWVPLVDFIGCLKSIVDAFEVRETSRTKFEAAESDDILLFELNDANLTIKDTKALCSATVPFLDFKYAVYEEFRRFRKELLQKHPELAENSAFNKYLPELAPPHK